MPSSTDYKTGYDKRNKEVLSWRRKAARDWEAVTWPGSSFQSLAAATQNARSPTVTSRVGQTSKAAVADERRRRREGMSATRVSLADSGGLTSVDNDKPTSPAWTWYAQSQEASVALSLSLSLILNTLLLLFCMSVQYFSINNNNNDNNNNNNKLLITYYSTDIHLTSR